jgi:hypothetical protein
LRRRRPLERRQLRLKLGALGIGGGARIGHHVLKLAAGISLQLPARHRRKQQNRDSPDECATQGAGKKAEGLFHRYASC